MRAFVKESFEDEGSVREHPQPQPGAGEALVRVRSAGVNPADAGAAKGLYKNWAECRFPYILGIDVSGTVERLGDGVDSLAVGDEVFGNAGKKFFGAGTFAEYVAVPAQSLVRKPQSVDDVTAATVGVAGVTALVAVDALEAKPGQIALVVGASGGVGSYAVQLLARAGLRVIAVARDANAGYLRELGAQETVDYSTGDVGEWVRVRYTNGIDAIVDLASAQTGLARLAESVKSGGHVVSTTGAVDVEALKARGIVGANIVGAPTPERLDRLSRLLETGALRPPQIRSLPLERAADALNEVFGKHVRGKLVLTIN